MSDAAPAMASGSGGSGSSSTIRAARSGPVRIKTTAKAPPGAPPMDPAILLPLDDPYLRDIPEHFEPDRLFGVLNRHAVEYIVVDGLAAVVHGAEINALDLDVIVEPSRQNLDRVADALRELDARPVTTFPDGINSARPADAEGFYTPAGWLDIYREAHAVGGYHDMKQRAQSYLLADHEVYVADLDAVIEDKEASSRVEDQLQLEALYDLRAARAGEQLNRGHAGEAEGNGLADGAPGQDQESMQDEAWHLRRLTLRRLAAAPTQRLTINSQFYDFWRLGQENRVRAIAAARKAAGPEAAERVES